MRIYGYMFAPICTVSVAYQPVLNYRAPYQATCVLFTISALYYIYIFAQMYIFHNLFIFVQIVHICSTCTYLHNLYTFAQIVHCAQMLHICTN